MRTEHVQPFDLHNLYQGAVAGVCSLGAGFLAMAADAGPLGQALVSVTGGLMAIITMLVKYWLIDRPKKSETKELERLREENRTQTETIEQQGRQIDDLSRRLSKLGTDLKQLKGKPE